MRLLDCLLLRSCTRRGSPLPVAAAGRPWGGGAQQDAGSSVMWRVPRGRLCVELLLMLTAQSRSGWTWGNRLCWLLCCPRHCWASSSILRLHLTSRGSHIREGGPTRMLQFSSQMQPPIHGRKWNKCQVIQIPTTGGPFLWSILMPSAGSTHQSQAHLPQL